MINVDRINNHIYYNLIQAYEAEFSQITGKVPDHNGMFPLDTKLDNSVMAYLEYINSIPIGIAAIKRVDDTYEMCEFYIIPSKRKMNHGEKFAHKIFDVNQGLWQIKQISGAEYASNFWRKIIYTYGVSYQEDKYNDEYWGIVTRQKFNSIKS